MAAIVRLEPGPLTDDLIRRLQGSAVFLSESEVSVEAKLREAGIEATIAGDSVPDDAVLILPRRPLEELTYVVDRLLGPGGCPWDQEQTHESLKKHLVEETYEVLDAIDEGDASKLREELGDLLLQPFMHAQIRKLRTGEFDIDAVAHEIVEKLVRRHPHVFGDTDVANAEEVLKNWDRIKQGEKGGPPKSILAGVPKAMPALLRAFDVSKRAARAGFEWPNMESVFDKLREEENELREEIGSGDLERIESEVGDLLFTAVNIARWAKVEPEEALRKMLDRFTRRFMAMEKAAAKPLREMSAQEWDDLWESAKSAE
ncbi:nucleoside triphosphate pyrophosphohydrolase [Fimbriimonas ginsengisoli]|uniref:Nucleoside triphosphate pyrophosphohydrolase MazG n=1 Tax=Fimbriimonas ginsengisoli Gsoil 348 TaxID=661478 RepID=A0A068NV11_FIMGI|nr:nucleoside triphosphate pyrophosphohydrolase [Fimbriimonas ginsengisoli]AIE87291.1 Nucleoside triphosphate pyrophosphohydrolase MazG [Fimbriimonas ginsengisoli Gsoil 348]